MRRLEFGLKELTMAIVRLGTLEMYFEVHGRGIPILLIAGYNCDHTFWSRIVPVLAEQFQVVIFDNRGVGRTTDDGEPFSIERMAADTAALIEHLGLSRPAVVGQSMGGAIAQGLLAHYPELCGRCAVVNSTQTFGKVTLMALESLLALRKAGVDLDLLVDASLPWFSGSEWLSKADNIAAFKAALRANPAPQSAADQERQLAALRSFDGSTWPRRGEFLTLVVSAAEDLVAPPREGKALANALGAKFIEVPGGHASPVEQAELLSRVLTEFIRQ